IQLLRIGKCDGCHQFHIWCWECGNKFAVPDNNFIECECGHHWIAWVNGEDENLDMQLMLKYDDEFGILLDRRPIH
ncbi:MAG: hypothetical protein AAF614_18320, partial [Chloroflexota bacterium]